MPAVPGPVRGLAAVSFLNDLASEMVYPLLPAFVTTTLGGGAVALGALDGAADLAASSLRWWSGRRADRPGWRTPLILVGYGLAVVMRPVIALTSQAWQVVAVRVLDRVGKGLRSPARDALIADVTPAAIRGRAFGLHRSADHLGAVLGSLLAFELVRRGVSVRDVIGWSLVPGLAAVAALVVALGIVRRRGAPAPVVVPVPVQESPPVPMGPVAALALLAAVRLPETLLLLRLQDLGAPIALVPLVWALLHVVKSAVSYPAGVLADRIGTTPALVMGTLAYAATLGGLAVAGTPATAVAVLLVHGLAGGLLEPAERSAVAAVAGGRRGQAFGSYQAYAGLGGLAAGLGYGWLYQAQGGGPALALAAAAAVLLLGPCLTVGRPKPQPGDRA